jgi:hypothetical protein
VRCDTMRDIAPARGGSLGACSQRGILHRPDRGVFTWANFLSTPCATPTSPPRGRSAARASRTHASAPLRLMPPVHPLNPGVERPTWSAGGLCPFVRVRVRFHNAVGLFVSARIRKKYLTARTPSSTAGRSCPRSRPPGASFTHRA